MKYDLSNTTQASDALKYLVRLTQDKKLVEIKKVSPKRSLNQNAYLHLLLGAFGQHFGYTLYESKLIWKQLPGNKEIFTYIKEVRGKIHTFYRSSADLTTAEMSKATDNLRMWSNEAGLYLPEPHEEEKLIFLENQIEQQERWL